MKAVLDWARAGGIVHRGVSPDSIVIEQDTNRLLVTLTPTPIPLAGLPSEVADARTLGALAWSLFTGRRFVDDDTRPPLGELCPNLAARVVDATERILRARAGDRAPDAAAFIGVVAVGDVLKQAEVEFAALDEEFASHFTGDRTAGGEPSSEAPERLLTGRSPGARESIFALGTIAALVLLIALGVGLAGRQHRNSSAPIVAQQMPTVPAAGQVDSGAPVMRNDSILTHSAAGSVADSTLRAQDSILRQNGFRDSILRDSVVRDSVTRDRVGRSRRLRDSVDRDSLDRDNARRDSLDEDAYRRDSVRNAFRAEARRDSVRRDSIQRQLMRSDSAKIDSLRNQALLQDSIRRETAKRDSIRRDSVRRDTIPRRPRTLLAPRPTASAQTALADPRAPQPLTLREARPDELHVVYELTRRAYAEYATTMDSTSWEALSGAIDAGLSSDQEMQRIVALDGDTIVGSALLLAPTEDAYKGFGVRITAPEVRLVAVEPSVRGRGIARALMNECLRRARSVGRDGDRSAHVAQHEGGDPDVRRHGIRASARKRFSAGRD